MMTTVTQFAIALVAALHVGFLVLEMLLWTRPVGRRVFRLSVDKAEQTRVLAANQGLYNGFLAAGLVWALIAPAPFAGQIALFFLCCVVIAGVFGALTASRAILFVQALPAALALGLLIV